jgi:hypothetical protein
VIANALAELIRASGTELSTDYSLIGRSEPRGSKAVEAD